MLVYIRESDKDKVVCNVDEKDIAEHLRVMFVAFFPSLLTWFQGLCLCVFLSTDTAKWMPFFFFFTLDTTEEGTGIEGRQKEVQSSSTSLYYHKG